VALFTVGESAVPGADIHWVHPKGRYERIFDPFYDVTAVPISHLLMAKRIIDRGGFDIVHDHNYLIGPAILADPDGAPILHTLHGPFIEPSPSGPASNMEAYSELARLPQTWFNGISEAQLRAAPPALAPKLIGVVHNALDLGAYPLRETSGRYFLTLARFSPEKGHATAARICRAAGERLIMAGAVGAISSPGELAAALDDPSSPHWRNRELRHFHDDVEPLLEPGVVEYIGPVHGSEKLALLRESRALLMPIDWEEPFGVAAVEAMACGVPVIAFARGALPELVEPGVTGFLARTESDVIASMARADEIDPKQCRAVTEERFSVETMTRGYLEAYAKVLEEAW
jgi:glycosyltransferase involved in cell wall biosynthesis